MARSEARLQFGVLEGLHGLSREAKLLYFTVLVEPTVNQAGVGALRDRLWAKRAELTAEETEQALRELDETRYVLVDHDTEEVFVRTLIRNDGVAERPNVLWSACRAALQVRSPKLRRELAEELRKLPPKPPDKVTKSGGTYAHPDPHSVADKIDPAPQPDPGERFDNPSATLPRNGSTTLPQPSLVEPFDNPSRTPGGGGGGGGEGLSPVDGQVGGSRASTRERPPQRPRCEQHRHLPDDDPGPNCKRCEIERLAGEQQQREHQNHERAAVRSWRAVVDACSGCDDNGFIETTNGQARHHGKPLRSAS